MQPKAELWEHPDLALARRIAAGDAAALRMAYQQHSLRVFHFIKRFVADHGTAEDVLADVFTDLWQHASRYEGRSSLNTWLCAMARFKALNQRRRYPAAQDPEAADRQPDDSDTPDIAYAKDDKARALKRCLALLSVEHREVMDLVYYHDKSVQDVSEILGVPQNTVKTRMFYARKKLAELMRQHGIDRGWP